MTQLEYTERDATKTSHHVEGQFVCWKIGKKSENEEKTDQVSMYE